MKKARISRIISPYPGAPWSFMRHCDTDLPREMRQVVWDMLEEYREKASWF